ncbi:protein FAR-RED IMPAIRED RESPONSE 1-like [Chenopodium quinoa]|uniref:protein FAR-RED IMPAIRED RESPONSE 1-like n=1 Tax=Chenopodium quinoa TaxID=63459 RepID=UPI000B77ACCF|nr:protein FAR-RED IMPAIRED RESPONSE 1-like [Chenopodium quinoa]
MGGNEPNCMITDQDPAMKIAIRSVFKKTEHRFCMWHIMKKLPDKVEKSIMQEETGFLKKLCACVWHLEIEPAEFEERWNKVMIEYHLEQHEWLGYMYKIRDKWIPAYFKDVFLGGIMRTTSRSESENNFFCSFINPHVSLVEFYLRYEAAIDAQRHTQEGKDEDIQDLVINLQGIRKDLEAKRIARNNETTAGSAKNKERDIELLIGASVPTEIIVKPPKVSKNKGTGVHVSNEETSKKKATEIDVSNVETRVLHHSKTT